MDEDFNFDELGIGDIAMQIMEEKEDHFRKGDINTAAIAAPPALSPNYIEAGEMDISDVSLDSDFAKALFDGMGILEEEEEERPTPVKKPLSNLREKPKQEEKLTESELLLEFNEVKAELGQALAKLKTLIENMTSVGSIGVNMAGPAKKDRKKKRGLSKPIKRY